MSSTDFVQLDATTSGNAAADGSSLRGLASVPNSTARQHLLTIGLEDYFQVGAFQKLFDHDRWDRFESRLERSTRNTLELLDRHQTKATFFVLGWVAEKLPELIREVAARGHEVASRGFYHRNIRELSRTEFKEDLARTREALETATGRPVLGHRVADGWFQPDDLWTLEVLAEEGYLYDSSIFPTFRSYAGQPWRKFVHQLETPNGSLWEIPPSTWDVLGLRLPIAGGNYFRQLPHTLLKRCVRSWDRHQTAPFVMYFHTWELDPEQPRISAGGRITQIRHYRNLNKMKWVLEDYLSQYRFGSVADVMGLNTSPHRACPGGSRASALLRMDDGQLEASRAKAREPLGQAQGGRRADGRRSDAGLDRHPVLQ